MSSSQQTVLIWVNLRKQQRLPLLLVSIVLCSTLWLFGAAVQLDYLADDSYILFRHVLQHSRGLGMIWDKWHPVQAHSSIAWAYLLRLGLYAGFPIEDSARFFGPVFSVLAVLCFTQILWNRLNLPRLVLALFCFVSFPPLVLWSSAGLETSLSLFLSLFFVSLLGAACETETRSHKPFAQLALGVLCGIVSPMIRPDLPLQLLCSVLCLFIFSPRSRRHLPVVVVSLFLGIVVYVAQNRLSFAADVAQPIATKFRIEWQNPLRFARYVLTDAPQLLPMGLLLLWLLKKNWEQQVRRDPLLLLVIGLLAALSIELCLLGGDELSRGRFLCVPAACILIAMFRLLHTVRIAKGQRYGFLLSLFLLSCAQVGWALHKEGDQPCSTWRRAAGLWLATYTTSNFTIAVAPAGYIPYFSDRDTIDLMGLAHPKIGRLPLPRGSAIWGETATEIAIAEGVCAVLLVVCTSPETDPRQWCEHPTLAGMVAALERHAEFGYFAVPIGSEPKLRLAVRKSCLPRIPTLLSQ